MEIPSLSLKDQSPGKEGPQALTSTQHPRIGAGDSHPGTASTGHSTQPTGVLTMYLLNCGIKSRLS